MNDHLYSPITCNGKLYGLMGLILVEIKVTIKDGVYTLHIWPLIPLPWPLEQSVQRQRTQQFVESCGEIFMISICSEEREAGKVFGNEIIGVEFHKLNFSAKAWEGVVSLRDQAFFSCSGDIGFSWPANFSGIIRNHISFTRGIDLHLYKYDIEEGTLSVTLPCPNSETPLESPRWIMPCMRSTSSFGQPLSMKRKAEQSPVEKMTSSGEEEDNKLIKRCCPDLPLDICKNISYGLDYFAYKNFSAVSTICRKAAPPFKFNRFVSPWLLSFHKNQNIFHIVGPERSHKYLLQVPESLQDATLCHCKDDWLLMCKYTQDHLLSVYFVNPFTKNVIRYPDLFFDSLSTSRFAFSCPPTSSGCIVIIVTFYGRKEVGRLNICSSREEGWKIFSLRSLNCEVLGWGNCQVFANGAFYFMRHTGELGVLTQRRGQWEWILHHRTGRSYLPHYQGFLAERHGEVISVFIDNKGKWMGFKLNRSGWEKIESLGKYTMYASRMSSFLKIAETPEMEDKIYLPNFHGNGALVSLCLRTGKFWSARNDVSFEDCYGTRGQLRSCWIRQN